VYFFCGVFGGGEMWGLVVWGGTPSIPYWLLLALPVIEQQNCLNNWRF